MDSLLVRDAGGTNRRRVREIDERAREFEEIGVYRLPIDRHNIWLNQDSLCDKRHLDSGMLSLKPFQLRPC